METLKQVKRWLNAPGNTKAKLAGLLGYETSAAITQWIKRGWVPERVKQRVLTTIKGEK